MTKNEDQPINEKKVEITDRPARKVAIVDRPAKRTIKPEDFAKALGAELRKRFPKRPQ